MNYWDHVLSEITGYTPNPQGPLYTNLAEPPAPLEHDPPSLPKKPACRKQSSKKRCRHLIEHQRMHMLKYFTQREAECIYLLAKGHTLKKASDILDLSPRTVEFYLNNIKDKMNLRTKKEVIQAILQTSFLQEFHFNASTSSTVRH